MNYKNQQREISQDKEVDWPTINGLSFNQECDESEPEDKNSSGTNPDWGSIDNLTHNKEFDNNNE